ncbi:hypothetical protein F5Y16DRAFT_405855 [Xylariaceae sp. FL0255]|nr:hypothetical protein F5Y16DRAFT_405855 [Xylariaceae sp. FL0255]
MTLTRHEDKTAEESWSDVNEDMAKKIEEIWKSGYGPDWLVTVATFCPPLDLEKAFIRVLELERGPAVEGELKCRYRIRDLDDDDGIEFETLSYCWGPIIKHRTILV